MFNKVLIANRGEIACRIAASANKIGLRTVAIFSEADSGSKHVSLCDEAFLIESPTPLESYLDQSEIINIAIKTGAGAIHPGYGFLSENSEFAQKVQDAGLIFVGPDSKAIEIMTPRVRTIGPDALVSEALSIMNSHSITNLFVVEQNKPIGIIHIHDCLRAGVA